MAGQLTIDTLKASTGVLATQNGMTGIAKAWVNINGTAGTIRASYNVSSVTRTAVGKWTVTFANVMPDANYAVSGCGGDTGGRIFCLQDSTTPTTSNVYVQTYTGSYADSTYVFVAINGN